MSRFQRPRHQVIRSHILRVQVVLRSTLYTRSYTSTTTAPVGGFSFGNVQASFNWEKSVKVTPQGLIPGSEIGTKVTYNWASKDEQGDVFQINKIESLEPNIS